VPTEAIALHIAILSGAFGVLSLKQGQKANDLDYSSRRVFFFVMLGVSASLVWLIYAAKTRVTPVKEPAGKARDVPVFEMVIATVAMAAWAAALPDTPFADFSWYGAGFRRLFSQRRPHCFR
jgi:uncharacterized membrane protein